MRELKYGLSMREFLSLRENLDIRRFFEAANDLDEFKEQGRQAKKK